MGDDDFRASSIRLDVSSFVFTPTAAVRGLWPMFVKVA